VTQLLHVKLMIRGIGNTPFSTYSQTLNGSAPAIPCFVSLDLVESFSGPTLVSRAGDEGRSCSLLEVL